MSLKTLYAVLTDKLNESLRAGEYNSELIAKLYSLEVVLMANQDKEKYINYNDRK